MQDGLPGEARMKAFMSILEGDSSEAQAEEVAQEAMVEV
jgi:hypothetical protein